MWIRSKDKIINNLTLGVFFAPKLEIDSFFIFLFELQQTFLKKQTKQGEE